MAKSKNFYVLSQTLWEDGEVSTEVIKDLLTRKKAVRLAFKKNLEFGGKVFGSGKNLATSTFYVEKELK